MVWINLIKTHIQEFQKRNIPVAVYAYVAAKDKKEMEKEAEEFYKDCFSLQTEPTIG